MIVLGYHWLTCYNPLIDWVLGSICFWQPLQHKSKSSPSVLLSAPLLKLLDPVPDIPKLILPVNSQIPPRVTLINTAAYSHASKLEGLNCFQLRISLPD